MWSIISRVNCDFLNSNNKKNKIMLILKYDTPEELFIELSDILEEHHYLAGDSWSSHDVLRNSTCFDPDEAFDILGETMNKPEVRAFLWDQIAKTTKSYGYKWTMKPMKVKGKKNKKKGNIETAFSRAELESLERSDLGNDDNFWK
jgi:hypothetical protein